MRKCGNLQRNVWKRVEKDMDTCGNVLRKLWKRVERCGEHAEKKVDKGGVKSVEKCREHA